MAHPSVAAGRLITLEGGEACGKSTQAPLLAERLQRCGQQVYLTREPGGTAEGEAIRQLFFDPQADWQPLSELFLILAARHQHVTKVLKPKLAAGVWVICDRFTDSTLVYQGLLGGLPMPLLRQQNQLACDGLSPDITFLLDLPLREVQRRLQSDSSKGTRQDVGLDHAACRQAFHQLASQEAGRIVTVDADLPAAQLTDQLMAQLFQRWPALRPIDQRG
ncbi:MAG: dTMP kinase [Alphaproteobacteria bacterium]|nr:dTMP kinase [Alphaproteobacteria bacterium]